MSARIEAAAKAMFDVRDDPYDCDEWDEIDATEREPYLCQARAAVDAADAADENLPAVLATIDRVRSLLETAEEDRRIRQESDPTAFLADAVVGAEELRAALTGGAE